VVDSPDEVARFPFVDPPDVRAVRDGVILLRELGALETVHATNKRHSAGTPPSSAQNDEEKTSTTTTTRLTVVGRKLARLPMDPRLARMILEGAKLGAAHAVSIIAAALSVQDVRERPAEFRERADQLHSRFVDPTSDFLSYLNLWEYLRAEQKARSGSAFRRMCKAEHLNFLRVREWQDVVAQLREMSRELDIDLARRGQTAELVTPPHPSHSARSEERAQSQNLDSKGHPASLGPATPLRSAQDNGDGNPVAGQFRRRWDDDIIHRALLAGLLSQIGMQETGQVKASSVAHLSGEARARALRQQAKRARNEYLGARGARFAIFPGSPLSKKPPAWVMAGELVETSRLWGRDVARIQPEWVEALAGELAKRTYSNPHWSTKQGAAMAREKVLLYGVPVVADRPVLYAKVDAEAAREMFIRHALVLGEWTTHHRFYAENLALLAEAEQVEARTRQRGLVASEDDLFAFYDERLPESIVSRAHFDKWWGKARRNTPDLLTFRLADLVDAEATAADEAGFPPTWTQGDVTLPLTYQFSPGEAADGVTVHIPLAVLPRLMPSGFDWMVPGMLDELCVATIKSLPKAVRVQLVPAPDVGAEVATWLRAHTPAWADMARAGDMAEPFHASFTRAVRALREVIIPDAAWDEARAERLPAHLRITFRVDTSPSYQLTNAKQAAPHHHSAGAQTTTPRHSTDANQTTTPRHSAGAQQSAESTIDESKDLLALQRRLAAKAEDAVRAAVKGAVGVALDEARAAAKPPPISPRHSARAERVAEPSVDGSRPGLGSATAFANAHSAQNDVGVAEQFNLTTWPSALPGGEIPESVSTDVGGGTVVRGYPALVVEAGAKVALRILATPADRDLAHPLGVRRLLLAENRLADARITSRWSGQQALTLASSPYRNTSALVEALQLAAVTALTTPDALPSSPPGSANPARPVADHAAQSLDAATVCDASAYDTAKAYVRQHLEDETYRTAGHVVAALAAYRTLEGEIRATTSLALLNVLQDIREHAASLIYDGFITDTPPQRLPHLVRYLRAASHRLEKAQTNPHRDAELAWRIHDVEQAYNASRAAYATGRPDPTRAAALVEVRWQLEELRVSLFAQQLGTDGPISEKRIRKALLG
ncbi:MAG: DUF3418 domain-containing protein, partial [Promicromonosporaceae bacterium]|nr:DUF3418 domain-containing protein [Promicromonosporaceae bacterium]